MSQIPPAPVPAPRLLVQSSLDINGKDDSSVILNALVSVILVF